MESLRKKEWIIWIKQTKRLTGYGNSWINCKLNCKVNTDKGKRRTKY